MEGGSGQWSVVSGQLKTRRTETLESPTPSNTQRVLGARTISFYTSI
jgi:hypothetical protein